MKTLLPLAFAAFLLLVAVSQATPVREQDVQAKDDELKDVVRDFELDTTERYDKIHSIKLTILICSDQEILS